MSPSAEHVPEVALVDVTEPVLERLLSVALHDADADEVAPPLGTAEGWNTERISWFRDYHHAAAAGLDGPAQQKTWAVMADGEPAGSIRLQRLPGPGSGSGSAAGSGSGSAAGSGSSSARLGAASAPGSARLGAGTLETGIWLGRSFRGRGIGLEALRLVKAEAAAAGADLLQAETTAGNAAAQALLRSAGAELTADGQQVTARFRLG